jgi:hypothetical protein
MSQETFEVKADSIDEAREKARQKTPRGFRILMEKVLGDGRPTIIRKVAEKAEIAIENAKAEVPAEGNIISIKEVQTAGSMTIRGAGDNEETVHKQVKNKLDETSEISSVSTAIPGKKGFLGIGKTQNVYDVNVIRKSVIELTYSMNFKVSFTITDSMINSWSDLCSIIKNDNNSISNTDLFSLYGYQVLFVMISGKINQPSYFKDIPFSLITSEIVERAKQYLECPEKLSQLGMFLPEVRYKVGSNGIQRASVYEVDIHIAETSDFLRSHGASKINRSDLPEAAYAVLMHFLDMPLLYFFFSLPYLETRLSGLGSRKSLQLSEQEAHITAYKGIDILLLQTFDELGPGEWITDAKITDKVLRMLKS